MREKEIKGLGASAAGAADRATDASHGAAKASPPSGSVSTGAELDTMACARRAAASVYAPADPINAQILAGRRDHIGLVQAALAGVRESGAPDLYEALAECVKRLRRCAAVAGNAPFAVDGLCEQFEAVLSKARAGSAKPEKGEG